MVKRVVQIFFCFIAMMILTGTAFASDGEVVYFKGYGFADIEQEVPMKPETTVFEWASISKTFIRVSVMQLEEKGKPDLTEDIRTYPPTITSDESYGGI